MGDLVRETLPVSDDGSSDGVKQSVDFLKATKELADITNMDNEASGATTDSHDIIQNPSKKLINPNIETVYENIGMDKSVSSEAPLHLIPEPPKEIASSRMQSSESGRMNKLRDHSSNIFPVGTMGCKEEISSSTISPRRFIDANEASKDSIGHIENTPRKMPSATAKLDQNRNPVTGSGVDATDEMKKASKKRVDGNPISGVGYDNNKTNSSTRIPPGGFSHGLW